MLDAAAIARATGDPLDHVEVVWPHVVAALEADGIGGALTQIAAAATIGVEAPGFLPVAEKRARQDRQPELWRLQERYWPSGFYGRGLIQLTWGKNYMDFGTALGVDLVGNPDLLLDPNVSARVLSLYFKRRGVSKAAEAKDWKRCRLLVNGGYIGLEGFQKIVDALLPEIG